MEPPAPVPHPTFQDTAPSLPEPPYAQGEIPALVPSLVSGDFLAPWRQEGPTVQSLTHLKSSTYGSPAPIPTSGSSGDGYEVRVNCLPDRASELGPDTYPAATLSSLSFPRGRVGLAAVCSSNSFPIHLLEEHPSSAYPSGPQILSSSLSRYPSTAQLCQESSVPRRPTQRRRPVAFTALISGR